MPIIDKIKKFMTKTYMDADYPLSTDDQAYIVSVWRSCVNIEQQRTALSWVEDLTYSRSRLHLTSPLILTKVLGKFV